MFPKLLVALALVALPAHAVSPRQQWQVGQQLGYEISVGGKVTLLDDDESPELWAGLPTDVFVSSSAKISLHPTAVDEAGTALATPILNAARLRWQGMGQVVELLADGGAVTATRNGKPEPGQGPRKIAPPRAQLRLTGDGRLAGLVPLPGAAPAVAGENFDFAALAGSWIWQSLPPLWPQGEVAIGAKWESPIVLRLTNPDGKEESFKIGRSAFTLAGEETVLGRKALRVAMDSSWSVAGPLARKLARPAPGLPLEKGEPGTVRQLADSKPSASGDLWFDAAAGQLLKASWKIQSHIHSTGTIKSRNGRTRPTENWTDFAGTMQLQLLKISYASEAMTP